MCIVAHLHNDYLTLHTQYFTYIFHGVRRYAAYPEYQASVSRFIPLPPALFGSGNGAKKPGGADKYVTYPSL